MDTQGALLAIMVRSAQPQDRDGGRLLLRRAAFPRLRRIWADQDDLGA